MDRRRAFFRMILCGITGCVLILFVYNISVGDKRNITKEVETKLDFTVCHDENLPKELKEIIEQKKETPFKLSYSTKEYTYITVGYGQQTMGGYSIQVKKLTVTDQAVIIKTVLKGPKAEEEKKGISYPYIVVKIQNMDKPVSFR